MVIIQLRLMLTVLDKKLISILDMRGQVPSEHRIKCLGDLIHHRCDEVRCCSSTNTSLVIHKLSVLVVFLETGKELNNIRVLCNRRHQERSLQNCHTTYVVIKLVTCAIKAKNQRPRTGVFLCR